MCPWRTISFSSTGLWHGGSDECGLRIADCGLVGKGCPRRVQVPSPLVGEGQGEGGSGNNYPAFFAHIFPVPSLFPPPLYLRPPSPLPPPPSPPQPPPPPPP